MPGTAHTSRRHGEPALSRPERRLWEAYPTGAVVELGTERPAGPDDGPVVRAEVISRLLLGARDGLPGHVPAVRLRGAYISGRLDISGGHVECALQLEDCVLEEVPDFSNAQTRQVRFRRCRMPGFDAGGLRVDGYLSLSGSVIDGEVRLPRAQITGGLRMNDVRITQTDPAKWAVFSGGLIVDVGAFIGNADITGGVRLVGARMNGGLFMQGSTLRNPGRIALDAENMIVEDAAEFSRGFVAEGTMRLRSVKVNGVLSFSRAVLRSGDPDRNALHASHMQVNELILWPAERISGIVSLEDSWIGALQDHPDIWPDRLRLNGLTYDSLRSASLKSRLDWVRLDREFHLQPYEQLAGWYRRIGHDDLARKAQLAKIRARRRTLARGVRFWSYVLDWTVGYGYRPYLASMWFGLLLAIGTTVFSVEHPRALKQPAEQPDFHAFTYTLDLLIPISSFGQREVWQPEGWTQWLAYALIAAGWLLATALIAGITRVLRPN